jgi:glycosyltransferase involved in cell wall biosynthesis
MALRRIRAAEMSGTLRVLHCISTLGGGGAERQLSYLAPELGRQGAEVHVAFTDGGPNLSRLRSERVQLHPVSGKSNLDWRLCAELLRVVRKISPDVIHSWLLQMDVVAGIVAHLTGTPHVVSERASEPAYVRGWRRSLREKFGRHADAIVANSVTGLNYWSRVAPKVDRSVIRNALPLQELDTIARSGGTAPVVVFAGRLDPQKNLPTMLRAMSSVARQRPTPTFELYGEGPQREELVRLGAELGVGDRIEILPFTSDLWQRLAGAAVFVSVSLYEGSPNTVLEAAALGCPMILSSIDEHRELFGPESARFVDPHDQEAISAAILASLDDEAGSRERARRARDTVAAFTIPSIASNYLALYRRVVAAGLG